MRINLTVHAGPGESFTDQVFAGMLGRHVPVKIDGHDLDGVIHAVSAVDGDSKSATISVDITHDAALTELVNEHLAANADLQRRAQPPRA